MTNHWAGYPVPAVRVETHFGREMRCFAERPANVNALIAASVAAFPEHEAVVSLERRLRYADLDRLAARVAANLAQRGVQRGDRVAIFCRNDLEFVLTTLATLRLGGIVVPLNTREQRDELTYILDQCGAKAVVLDTDLADRLPELGETPALTLRFAVAGNAPGTMPFEPLLDAAAPDVPIADVGEEDTAVILYTSGTTGHPKGAMLTHLNLVHTVLHYRACMRLTARDRSLLAVPASHVTGLAAILFTMLGVGGCVIMMREFKASAFLALAGHERMTHTLVVPAIYALLLRDPDFDDYDLSAWRVGGFGGAPMPEGTLRMLAERLPELALVNAYGATETTSPTTMMPADLQAAHLDSVGVSVPCGEVRVVDERGHDVPPSEAGELWIAGPMVVPGYWDNPEANAREFAGSYWKSGDIGSMDPDGFVRLFDRKKDLVNRGGYKVYSAEVESALSTHPAVAEAALVARADPVLGEKSHAFVVLRDRRCTAATLRKHCVKHLADYKVPDFFTLLDEPLPRNANGKVMKRTLREKIP
ncbi:MAG: acyl--CoA ligase [Betaproteobacteria bacterium]|jgi:O-succinylbenzoic acid--CoA ligase|nr:acyl--CoA ligase [Betaproteobacteria bacterium]